jgi:hypothetical protein
MLVIKNQSSKIEQQKEGWSKAYGRPVSQQECEEIRKNLTGFFETLKQWDDEERTRQEDGNKTVRNTNHAS